MGTIWLGGCSGPDANEIAPARETVVQVHVVAGKSWNETLDLTAQVLPWAAVTMASEVSGRVSQLPVDEGDRVALGQVVARLDAAETEAQLAQAQARVASSRATVAQAERDHERGRSLASSDGLISEDELDRLTLALEVARATLLEAEAGLLVIEERFADSILTAPFSGVIGERWVEVGSWVAPGQSILRLVDNDRVKVRGAASQTDRVGLVVGTPVEVEAFAVEQVVFHGKLRVLGQEVDQATGTYGVEAALPSAFSDTGDRLLPGMHVVMSIALAGRNAIVIPESAVLEAGQETSVFVVEDDVARHRRVAIELLGTGEVAVHSGLVAGDVLVVGGQYGLEDGAKVHVDLP